ncbi:MAG TPA: hypothetical protein VH165_04150 [Kofleriaceae bacterium]|nr:hypothetical protein [Kofleriaceae bacterium]
MPVLDRRLDVMRRTCEDLGPRGPDYAMGAETFLLLWLKRGGAGIVYLPRPVVHHHVSKQALSLAWLARRARLTGRGSFRMAWETGKEGYVRETIQAARKLLWHSAKRFMQPESWAELVGSSSRSAFAARSINAGGSTAVRASCS